VCFVFCDKDKSIKPKILRNYFVDFETKITVT